MVLDALASALDGLHGALDGLHGALDGVALDVSHFHHFGDLSIDAVLAGLAGTSDQLKELKNILDVDADPTRLSFLNFDDWAALETTELKYRQAEQMYRADLLKDNKKYTQDNWSLILYNLGIALTFQGRVKSDFRRLHDAEKAFREALTIRTQQRWPKEWIMIQSGLGSALLQLGVLTGEVRYFQESRNAYSAALDEAVTITPERKMIVKCNLQQASSLYNNAATLYRYAGELTGDAKFLRGAVMGYETALKLRIRTSWPMEWALTQNNLGVALQKLGNLTGEVSHYVRAREVFYAALEVCTRERSLLDWIIIQNNICESRESESYLTESVALLRESARSLRLTLNEPILRRWPIHFAETQTRLGNALARIGDFDDDKVRLREAEQLFRAALVPIIGGRIKQWARRLWPATTKAESSDSRKHMIYADIQSGLGFALRRSSEVNHDAARLRKAETAYLAALKIYDSSDREDKRQDAIAQLARLLVSAGRYVDAADHIERALQRSDAALADSGRSYEGHARAVDRVGDLYSLLSLCRLRQVQPDRAVALLAAERGRARLVAAGLALDTVRIEEIDDPLVRNEIDAARNRRTGLRVQLGYDRIGQGHTPWVLLSEERARLQAALRQASDTYTALLLKNGLIRTSEHLTLQQISTAVPQGGALILPVLTGAAAFAFVVTNGGTLEVLELPDIAHQAVAAHLSRRSNWRWDYHRHFHLHRGKDPKAAAIWNRQLTGTLAWLWERLLAPIHLHLRDVAGLAPNAPVVLLPPGLLGLLSLHAAGPGPDGRYFGDHWTVSYAPSVRSLLTCQARRDERVTKPARLLAAIDPDGSLSGARAEGPMLRQRFAAPDREPVILTGDEATVARVLGGLSDTTVFHASTHGAHDGMEPARSGLLLADGVLELDIVRQARLDAMRLVFLSACESGLAGVRKLPEEFIGLPTGFVEAGAAAVVGSLWPIGDTSAFLLARRFYNLMFDAAGQERMAPATALRTACAWLRDVTYGELKQEFPLVQLPTGPALVLRSARMMPGPTEPEPPAPEDMHLPLGPDDERPFVHPTHWAAFACTGC